MTEPTLNRPRRDSVRMVHRCKRLAEPMQNPMLTACRILAGNRLAVQRACAVTAVQASSECPLFEHS